MTKENIEFLHNNNNVFIKHVYFFMPNISKRVKLKVAHPPVALFTPGPGVSI